MKKKYNIAVSLMYLCFTFLFLVKSFKISGAVWGEILICTLFQYCIIELFIYFRKDIKVVLKYMLLLMLPVAAFIYLFREKIVQVAVNIGNAFEECFNNFINALNSSAAIPFNKITLIIMVFTLLLTIIIYFMVSKKLEMIVTILLCVLMGVMYRFGYKKTVVNFTMAFVVLNLIIIALKNNFMINSIADNSKKIISIMLAIIVVCLCTNALPKNYSGIEKITFSGVLFGNEKKVIGYDDLSKKLGGALEENSDVAFEYSFPFGVSDGITYFRGQTYDVYDGKSWTKSKYQNVIDSKDYKEKFKDIDKKYVDYVDIYPKNLKVSTFLAPEQSYYVKKDNGSSSNIDLHNKVFNNGTKISGNYRVEFIDKSITKNLKDGSLNYVSEDGEDNESYKTSIEPYENFINEYDELSDSKTIEQKYLSLPDTIPDSMKKQLEEIIDDYQQDSENYSISDYEKVTAIYKYLCNRCSYDLNASNLPKGRDFVDFFLNSDKKGYCMHFATACVVLCRMEGIPARLVTGFKETLTGKKPNEKYSVTNNQAHAWCEVFMNDNIASNVGRHWITVDPTPDKDGICEGIEATKIISDDSESIVNLATNEVTYSSKNYHSETDFDEKQSRAKELLDEEGATDTDTGKKISKKVFIPIGAILALIIIRMLIIALKYRRLKKKQSNIKIAAAMINILGFIGLKKQKTETELEFADKIDDYYLKTDVIKIIELCNAEYYGNKDKNSEGYKLLLSIKKQIKAKMGFEFYIKQFFFF